MNYEALWSGILLVSAGLFVLIRYGLTREALHFNRFNPWKKPLPVWAARLIYVPLGLMFLYFGVLNLKDAYR